MREIPLSRCEREFVNRSICENTRLDGRELLEARPVKLYFGSNWGCCLATLGQTRVVANISCDIQPPQSARPNEGKLQIFVELNPMAAPHFEAGRQSEMGVFITRQLEKCFKDSKCIDLESLCIVADQKVWNIRVDVNVINHDGNLVDCACIATLAALSHFHRPDVTTNGEEVIVHSFAERDPLPLTLFHYPICISFATFENGRSVIDPTYMEERLSVAQLTLGLNSYREVCSLHFDYTARTGIVTDVISAVSNKAANHCAKIVKLIREVVKQDIQTRYDKESATSESTCRLENSIANDKIMSMMTERISIKLAGWNGGKTLKKRSSTNDDDSEDVKMNMDTTEDSSFVVHLGKGSAELNNIGEGGKSTWTAMESSDEDDESDDIEMIGEAKVEKQVLDEIDLSGDSEEETTETLQKKDLL
ncbi:exosome complex component rrp45 isoform X2 [Venturia canescens]|uniref:exosome complex component rrp45 isoform X2 n=1 Tax=Venturia canescens TaxID=32260 RepID=UPI001C9C3111|nr:exosome complex component rrp45 isoform X2 [Venturia canescens]